MREERAKEGLCSWQCQPCLAKKRNSITSGQMSRVQSMRGRFGAIVFFLRTTLFAALAAGIMVPTVAHAQFSDSYHRSEEHTSELQSLMRISYAVFCLKKKTIHTIRQ